MTIPTARQKITKTIVLVINDLKGNGAERVVLTLARHLQTRGYNCHIVCFKHLEELPTNNVNNIHVFPMQNWRWLPRKLRTRVCAPLLDRFIIKQADTTPDLVLSNLLPVDRILSASKLPNVQLIIHNTMSQEFDLSEGNGAGKPTFNMLRSIYTQKPAICVSAGVQKDFRKIFPDHQAVRHIYNPVDIHSIQESAKQENPIKLPRYLVHVGKFKAAKRHDRLLEAYAKSNTQLPLVLVGQGPLETQNRQLAQDLGIEDQVHFAGFHSNPYPIIKGATALLLSSDYEGLGLVILEALALDIPVLSTNCPSGPAEILPEKNLVPIDDPDAFAEKITAIAQTPDNFKSAFPKQFLPEVILTEYLKLLHADPVHG